jgi:3-methyladenine DNA glycosylase AlkD
MGEGTMLVSYKHGDQFSTQKQTKVSNLWKQLEAKDIFVELAMAMKIHIHQHETLKYIENVEWSNFGSLAKSVPLVFKEKQPI